MGKFLQGCADQLILYVRHRAWLDARPKDKKGKPANLSRLQRFRADEAGGVERKELAMPPLEAADHLVDHLFSIGPGDAGEVISFREIEAWQRCTGHRLSPWEAETLRMLSGAYLSEHHAAADPARAAPYREVKAIDRTAVSNRLKAAFEQLERQDAQGRP